MKKVTLIPGDGVGSELAWVLKEVFSAMQLDIILEEEHAGEKVYQEEGEYLPQSLFDSIEKNKVAIKGPITTPIGHGFRSLNVALRKKYDLYCNIRPIKNLGQIPTKYEDLDLVIFRENTQDLYAGIEEKVDENTAHAIKVISYDASYRLIKKAFTYAEKKNYTKVTVVTKANIMKLTDGLFLKAARDVAKDYLGISLEEILIDNMCMQLVLRPEKFGVIATENLYGDILSDLCAGLIGGLGLVPGANIGDEIAIFESVHGSAPDIAGKNLVNPTAFLLTSCLLLDYLGEEESASRLRKALDQALSRKENFTRDLGGNRTTKEFTEILIEHLK